TMGHLQHLNILVALAWIPLVLASVAAYLDRGAGRRLGLAAAALAMALLGGHPQIVVYGLVLVAAYVAVRLARTVRPARWRSPSPRTAGPARAGPLRLRLPA